MATSFSSYGPRAFSNNAPPQALVTGVAGSSGATTLKVTSTSGYPTDPTSSHLPFLLSIERGTPNQEVCLCVGTTGTTFTVIRGFNGTSPKTHGPSSIVEHSSAELDFAEANSMLSLIQTPGDIVVGGPTGTSPNPGYSTDPPSMVRLPRSTVNGDCLTVNLSAPTGLSYKQPIPTGVTFHTFAATAPAGYVLADGTTRTGCTTVLSPYHALYILIGGTGGVLVLPDLRGRYIIGAGHGSGLTTHALKSHWGKEKPLTQHTHVITGNGSHSVSITDTGHFHTGATDIEYCIGNTPSTQFVNAGSFGTHGGQGISFNPHTHTNTTGISASVTISIGANTTGSNTLNTTMPPSYALNTIIKL